jgi:hypothetical protein
MIKEHTHAEYRDMLLILRAFKAREVRPTGAWEYELCYPGRRYPATDVFRRVYVFVTHAV